MPGVLYAFAGYLVLAIVVTFPLALSFGTSVSDPVDPILNSWALAWEHHALLSFPGEFLNANIFYPHRETLLYSETLLVPSLLLLPVTLAFDNALVTHNLLLISGFTFTGMSGYLLGRWLFRNHWSGWVMGGILAFNAYTISNIGQAQLLHLEWLPLALLYLGKSYRMPTLRNALLLAFFLAAQFYTAVYYGIFGFVIVSLVGVVVWFVYPFVGRWVRLRAFGSLVAGLLIGMALCLPLALPYYHISERYAFRRTLADAWPFSASLEMWLSAPANHLLYGNLLGDDLPKLGYYVVDSLFPGFIVLMVAGGGLLLWLVRSFRTGRVDGSGDKNQFLWPVMLLAGIALFFLLSLGPFLQRVTLQPDFAVVLPYAWLHDVIPGFQALRAPGRFAVVVMLGIATAAGYLFLRIRWLTAKVMLLLVLTVEAGALAPQALYTPDATAEQDAAYQWLAGQLRTGYLELPLYPFGSEGDEARWLDSQFQSINHWHSTPLGYSGFFPPRYYELQEYVDEFPRADVLHFLQVAGVEWLILHRQQIAADVWQQIEETIANQGWVVEKWGDLWIVYLLRKEQPPPEVRYYIPETARRGDVVRLGAILTSESPTPAVPGSEVTRVRVEWWRDEKQVMVTDRVYQPPFTVDSLATAPVAVPVPDQVGEYSVQLYDVPEGNLIPSATVNVVEDVAPPEAQLLPVRAVGAEISCHEGEHQLDVLMQTIGWYDSPFTLSARVLDANGVEVARSAADVAFPPEKERSDLLSRNLYSLPLGEISVRGGESLLIELLAYQWQQEAERIVGRRFVLNDGSVADSLRLPVTMQAVCE